jgi:hypothetical protein
MNLNDVKNAFGRQTANGNTLTNNKSDGSGVLLLLIVGVGAYLCYKYMLKDNSDNIKIKKT